MAKRADWGRFIVGSRGDDDLKGTAGRDVIVGRNGADVLEGRAGNDLLIGDDAHGGWHHCFWWRPTGSLDDYLDGGAGSDLVLAGRGNDVANYTLSENSRAHDVYDGGKGFDTFCPVGTPVPVGPEADLTALEVICRVNGAVRQQGYARDMAFGIPFLLSYISHIMTLEPGDLVATGTPEGVGPLRPGDVVEVEIPGVGVLRNPVADG